MPIFPRSHVATLLLLTALIGDGIAQGPLAGADPTAAPRPAAEETRVLETGRLSARRKALGRLGSHPDPAATQILLLQLDRLDAGELPPALWLDLFEAAAKRNHPALKARLAQREKAVAQTKDPLSGFRECLEGGDAEAGRVVFAKRPEAGCIRCHTVTGEGGKIGPDLTWLRHSMDRVLILESIIVPNATIATGFASVLLTLKNGETLTGVVSHESSETLTLTSVVDGKKNSVQTAEILERAALPSPMPPHIGVALDKRAIRDLVEFIAIGD